MAVWRVGACRKVETPTRMAAAHAYSVVEGRILDDREDSPNTCPLQVFASVRCLEGKGRKEDSHSFFHLR
jgi:hypothetical protein